jgi:nuclear transport factor 2 (NTF2) superfamily protein
MDKPPLPPFTLESATQKVRLAEDAWNTRDPNPPVSGYLSPLNIHHRLIEREDNSGEAKNLC